MVGEQRDVGQDAEGTSGLAAGGARAGEPGQPGLEAAGFLAEQGINKRREVERAGLDPRLVRVLVRRAVGALHRFQGLGGTEEEGQSRGVGRIGAPRLGQGEDVRPGPAERGEGIEPRRGLGDERRRARVGADPARGRLDAGELVLQRRGRLRVEGGVFLVRVEERLERRDQRGRFLAAVAVRVRAVVAVVRGERPHGSATTGIERPDRGVPRRPGVVGVRVPTVVGHPEEGDLRGLRLVHRVGGEPGHDVRGGRFVAIHLAQQQVVAHEVGDRVVPPDEGRAAEAAVDPVHARPGNVVHHRLARPHHLDRRVELLAQDVEVGAGLGVGPGLVVLGRAQQQRRDVGLGLDEVAVETVE